jgi:Glycosyl transferases group 1
MGLPVIATRIPGCVDAVREGETGLLVPARDAGALTAAIRTYLGDPKLRRQHGANGRHRALRDFDPCESLFQEYLRLLGERGCEEVVKSVCPNPDHLHSNAAKGARPSSRITTALTGSRLPFCCRGARHSAARRGATRLRSMATRDHSHRTPDACSRRPELPKRLREALADRRVPPASRHRRYRPDGVLGYGNALAQGRGRMCAGRRGDQGETGAKSV